MGVLELIQQKSFIGPEFLTWLWYQAERHGKIIVGEQEVEIEVLGPITLEALFGDAKASTLKGDNPVVAPEAGSALMEGKKLRKAKFGLAVGDEKYVFAVDGEQFSISGLSAPKTGKLPFDDMLNMRLGYLADFDELFHNMFEMYLTERLDENEWAKTSKDIQKWVSEKDE